MIMKILQINAVYNKSSTGRNAWEMHKFLLDRGHDSRIASPDADEAGEKLYKIGNLADRKVHALFSRITGLQGYFSKGATKKLLQYMDKFEPDVVLLGNLHGNYIHVPLLLEYLKEKNVATVVVLHDCWMYTGKCVHYYYSDCDRWLNECGKCPELKSGNKSWFFDRTKKMINDKKRLFNEIQRLAFVGVSEWITQEISKSTIGKNALFCRRVYNWIDFDKFYAEDNLCKEVEQLYCGKQVILGVAGEWNEAKRFSQFLHIAEKLDEKKIIVLVGKIDSQIMLPSNVIGVGEVNSIDELRKYYNRADVFLNLSGAESFGKVAAEAMACATPVVCYNSTANGEIVGEGCGCVVPENDIEAIIVAINKICSIGKQIYSEECVRFAKNNFDKERNLLEYENVLNQVVRGVQD